MTQTRITLQGVTTLQGAPPRPWVPQNNVNALSRINSIEPVFNFTALTTFPGNRDGFRLWGTTDLPSDANGAAVLSVDAETAGRRAGGGAGSNYNVAMRDSGGGTIFGIKHFIPFASGPLGFHIRNDNFPTDPNGAVWTPEFINSTPFEFGLFQDIPAATGVSVSYIDMEILWAGASGGWVAIGISLLLPMLLPIFGEINLQHLNDVELAAVHHVIKQESRKAGMTSYPSIVLREEREKVFKALSRPVYGV